MNKLLNCVLLVDDDSATNFINEIVIQETGLVRQVVKASTGVQALEFLKIKINSKHPQPEIILLDINMPAMDGWEFMEAYRVLEEEQKAKIIVVMLTTSLNPDDEERARNIKEINDFRNKPLTAEIFIELVEKFFPELM